MKVLYSFEGDDDGKYPVYSPMVRDQKGNLFGVTNEGGKFGLGTVFELTKNSKGVWAETVIHTFAGGRDGAIPYFGLEQDAEGNLYGVTTFGGGLGDCPVDGVNEFCGTVFELTPGENGKWVEHILFRFDWGTKSGGYPKQTPTLDNLGNLYGSVGTGTGCGGGGCGSIFELIRPKKGRWKEKFLYNFSGPDGADCYTPLLFDDEGNLYGATISGGAYDAGTVFQLVPTKTGFWKETVLHSFDPHNYDGGGPTGVLALDKQGNLFGATPNGGKFPCYGYGCGVVYELDYGTWEEHILTYFREPGGDGGGVALDAVGDLYGTRSGDEQEDNPIIFKLVPEVGGRWASRTIYQFEGNDDPAPRMVISDGSGGFYGVTMFGGDYGYGSVFQIVP
jgi:uncharacterized repeat protein (TIGR03803 family)